MLNLKVKVKNGEVTPREAMYRLISSSNDPKRAKASKTGRWLASSTAQKRYDQALKRQENDRANSSNRSNN